MKILIGPAFFGVPRAYAACEAIARNSDEANYTLRPMESRGFIFIWGSELFLNYIGIN